MQALSRVLFTATGQIKIFPTAARQTEINNLKRRPGVDLEYGDLIKRPLWRNPPHHRKRSAADANIFCVSESRTCVRPVCPAHQTFAHLMSKVRFGAEMLDATH
jgi:hypothetical protein